MAAILRLLGLIFKSTQAIPFLQTLVLFLADLMERKREEKRREELKLALEKAKATKDTSQLEQHLGGKE